MTTLQRVELGVLGTLQVRQYGLPVAIPGAKPRAILTMLGLYGDSVVSADTLVELLWGDDPPRTAAKALQTHISALRRTLGDGFVLTEGTGWTLRTTEIDATRYRAAVRLGRDAIAAGDVGQAVVRFDEALSLWRGTPELPDSSRGNSEKTRWIESHAALVEDRADALLATGRAAEIIGELEAAVADAPLRERRWGQLMLALYRAGRQGEALGAFQRARSLLANELGVDPGPDLRRLEAAIVAQDAALEIPVSQQLSAVTRAVTFLLTDIEGSTAAWEADADSMAVALARHDEIAEQVVTSHGGRLVKTRGEGDATFSVFDRPSAAAGAAIALQEAIRHEPWALAQPMRIRVALHTGEVELRDGDYFGRAVNRAARLRSLAAGGQILCSGATAELVIDTLSDDVLLLDLGTRQLKNLARPEHVFELRLETADEAGTPAPEAPPIERPDLPSVLGGSGPFVGRGRELEGLLTAWQTTLETGAHAVLIAGEPGVGKTRLAGEWSRQAYEQGAVVLYGRCDEDLGAPYQPFSEALRALVPCLGPDRLRGMRGVESLLPLVPGLTDALPDLAGPTRADPDTERYALFDAVVALLGVASTSAPVVLVLDDLHWAAKPTLLLLRHLLRFGEHARVQIVGTYRSTDLDRSHPLASMLADLHRDGSAHRLALSGLDEDDVTAYVAEAGYDDEELARALASVTGGNPFFLIEALRHVDESGGRWDPSTLPQGVREAVSRRLSRLPAETNKALAAAAVVGSRFALDLVERITEQDLIDAFDEASKAGIVIEEPGGYYRFNHALVRQSLLAELASVRRMRLHQRIATTLETEPGADDELLAELAYHYFECAWAGNAAKAVEYCRRAADQAMARLAYEGAADYYDKALHALDELDDELPDREDLQAELLVARCEALLAAGDVVSARGAVSQLQAAAGDSARLAGWGTCFDGEVSMLTDPERLDEIEGAVAAAAENLAGLGDAAGEAKAHTVRAVCLGRLGRIADCETALDQALTAARRAGEHRRVNAVLATAPLAALWGPNPVPRAGGRCLDVVRLLRITTGSPVVEATSTRCQGVLDAFRGRAAAGRQLIESARRSLTELGMRHALLEVEQFAGLVELVADDPAAAEPHLRKAYNGFRRMGLDADTAETAAVLARACLELGRDAEADELCTESERLAGHALKAAIEWRTVRAQLLSRGGAHAEAKQVAEEGVALAERTDALVSHGDACLALATVLAAAGDAAGARAAAERALGLYEQKGAAALAEKARSLLVLEPPAAPPIPQAPVADPDTTCVRIVRRAEAAFQRQDWDSLTALYAPNILVESRRKIVGFNRGDLPTGDWFQDERRLHGASVPVLHHLPFVAVRGERLTLARIEVGAGDTSPGAPRDELLQLCGVNEEGQIDLLVWFDVEDIDAAIAELDNRYRAGGGQSVEPDNACARVARKLDDAYDRNAWDEFEQLVAPVITCESRRKIVGVNRIDQPYGEWLAEAQHYRGTMAAVRHRNTVVAVRGERLALTSLAVGPTDQSPGAPRDEMLQLYGLDQDGRLALQMWFDVDDIDAAVAELDALHALAEKQSSRARLENAASRAEARSFALFAEGRVEEIGALFADAYSVDDRRPGLRHATNDRAAAMRNIRAIAALGGSVTHTPIALRGDRLCLSHIVIQQRRAQNDAFSEETLDLVEIDADGVMTARIVFDPADLEAGIEELDARYLAGEAADHTSTWSKVASAYATLNQRELPATTPDWVNIDHRRLASVETGSLAAYVRDAQRQWGAIYIEAVHRLSDTGAVVSRAIDATSQEGFDAEWREIDLLTFEDNRISRLEIFDEDDLDTALARFEQLNRRAPQLENAASRASNRLDASFAARDWTDMADVLADDFQGSDRRQVLTFDIRGRDAVIESYRAAAGFGVLEAASTVLAIRAERLVLTRVHYSVSDAQPGGFTVDLLQIIEIDSDERIVDWVAFDISDLDSAIAELDARYLAGEAAPYSRTWSTVAKAYAAFNRHDVPPSTPDWVYVDNRRLLTYETGNPDRYAGAVWDETPDIKSYIETVHRLTDLGAVVTHATYGTSQDGFDAEWRMTAVMTVDGDRFTRYELFDDTDLDAALERFEQLKQPALQLENAASQVYSQLSAYFSAGDWTAMSKALAPNMLDDDRRRTVNAGIRHGRNVQITNGQAVAATGTDQLTSTVLAIRGNRLALCRSSLFGRDEQPGAYRIEFLSVIEVDVDGQLIVSHIAFDPDDVGAALSELDARYIAGEAAEHAHTWSVIAGAYAAFNRNEPSDVVNIDHRKAIRYAPGELTTAVYNDVTPNLRAYIEAVHRLSEFGAVVTSVSHGTSQDGFEAVWRQILIQTVDGDVMNRNEIFDESDLDAALARFDEISRPAQLLENAASRAEDRLHALYAESRWDEIDALVADGARVDERRRVIRVEGDERATLIDEIRVIADLGVKNMTSEVLAIRGDRLVLSRVRFSGRDQRPDAFHTELLRISEIGGDGRYIAAVSFDLDDLKAAVDELDTRYLAGEASTHPQTWSVIMRAFAALNRREVPATTPNWVRTDHRSLPTFGAGDWAAFLHATWSITPDVITYIEAVHRLTELGAVVTHAARGTSHEGFDAEWRMVDVFTVEGDLISRGELFDEIDLDGAIARFDELDRQAPPLENAASRTAERLWSCYAAGDWNAVADSFADDVSTDDRRRVVNAGPQRGRVLQLENLRLSAEMGLNFTTTVIATRGERLVLTRIRSSIGEPQDGEFGAEVLDVIEIGADGRISGGVLFDPDDVNAAFAELDARYMAGEAAVHAHTWSVTIQNFAAFNRHELPSTTQDWVTIDHRRATPFESDDLQEYIRSVWDECADFTVYIETVHRMNALATVITQVSKGTSQQGFAAEWREINLSTIDGELIRRTEIFDETDLDAALTRFEQLSQPAPRLENTASRVDDRVRALFAAGDWDAIAETLADDVFQEDRRHVVGAGRIYGPDAVMSLLRAIGDFGTALGTADAIATRGERLVLSRLRWWSGPDHGADAYHTDSLIMVEIDGDERISALINFDLDDLDSAFAELDTRFAAGEAAGYSHAWRVVAGVFAAHNRREVPAMTPDVASVDHRRVAAFAPGEGVEYVRAGWDLNQDVNIYIETVHRASALGAVFSFTGHGTSSEGFEADWRGVELVTVEGDLVSRCEVFDESDLDAALARFEELSVPLPKLENAATRTYQRFEKYFASHDWTAMAEIVADDNFVDDRRRTVNAGLRESVDSGIDDVRAAADAGFVNISNAATIATRGDRLALVLARASDSDEDHSATFYGYSLNVIEVDADGKFNAVVVFDPDENDSALTELDVRYLASEAAPYAQIWSAVTKSYMAGNAQHLILSPDCVSIDHRRMRAFEPGEIAEYMTETWKLAPNVQVHVETVHRLSDLGAVVTHAARGASQQGFEAEWRETVVLTVEDDLINRCEMYDETDLDAALAKFDELSRPASRLENTASRVMGDYLAHFATRDWDVMAEALADDFSSDDRRRDVVNSGVQIGRDAEVTNLKAIAEIGCTEIVPTTIAIRGERLTLTSTSFTLPDWPQEFRNETLDIAEINADGKLVAHVAFDRDNLDAAIAELDARYLAGEAAAYASSWQVVMYAVAELNRHETGPIFTRFTTNDHRRLPFAPGDLGRATEELWELVPDARYTVSAVHALQNRGAVISMVIEGTDTQGNDLQWARSIAIDISSASAEVYEDDDLDAALARFEEFSHSAPRLENTAIRVVAEYAASFAGRAWDAMAELLADDFFTDDRRHVVNAGVQHGRETELSSMRTIAGMGTDTMSLTAVATRGDRLVLNSTSFSVRNWPQETINEILDIVEVNAEGRVSAHFMFDPDDIGAAFAELEKRYLAGEAAPHAHTWSVVAGAHEALNRRELPATTPTSANVDHRKGAAFGTGDLMAYISSAWDLMPDIRGHIETVHHTDTRGAVVAYRVSGTTQEGFDAEWRQINIVMVDGDLIDRIELFDDDDLDAALRRFDELTRLVPPLDNAATRVYDVYQTHYAARNWDALAQILAQDISIDDRRRVVNSGVRRGRNAAIAAMRDTADIGTTDLQSMTVATRGDRLMLTRGRYSGGDQASDGYSTDVLCVFETDADHRATAVIVFDPDDIDAALAELDARYLAGDAAPNARTWSIITRGYSAANRGELAVTAPDVVNIDHRRLAMIESGNLIPYLRDTFDELAGIRTYIEAVHRLTGLGAVVTHVGAGKSKDGFDAEWRMINVLVVDGDLVIRSEVFDEADLNAALARFDELNPPAAVLQNAASRALAHMWTCIATRDWAGAARGMTEDFTSHDHRHVVNAGVRRGRDAHIANMQAVAEVGFEHIGSTLIATRGQRLALSRTRSAVRGQAADEIGAESIMIVEVDADDRLATNILFDIDELDAAFAELDRRHLAGEAAAHARTWSVVTQAYAAFNRGEMFATTPNWGNVDHRRGAAFAPGQMAAYLQAIWNVTPDESVYIESIQRLSSIGAIVTHAAHWTSQEGFAAEWRVVALLTVEGDLITRVEFFDESDLDAALARFDELSQPVQRLENMSTRVAEHYLALFAGRDWNAMTAMLADDFSSDDRRRVVGVGVRRGRDAEITEMRAISDLFGTVVTSSVIATRGTRLHLARALFSGGDKTSEPFRTEVLSLFEIGADERITATVQFDADDIDTAFAELDARYLAGEAAACSQTWTAIAEIFSAIERRELPATSRDWVHVDHRPTAALETADATTFLGAVLGQFSSLSIRIETVHRLTELGAVITHSSHGTSQDGFEAEWRMIDLLTVGGGLVNRGEVFDEAELDAALARFDELSRPTVRLENAASRASDRFFAYFRERDWTAMAEVLTDDSSVDDRGRDVTNIGLVEGRDALIATLQAVAEAARNTTSIVAIRGQRLALARLRTANRDPRYGDFDSEMLIVVEIDSDERIVEQKTFDVDDIDAAFAELERRYLSGEAAAHAEAWSVVVDAYAAINRHDLRAAMRDWTTVDHRAQTNFDADSLTEYIRATWELTPNIKNYVEAVHRLNDRGAVVTHAAYGTSPEGFEAEWRMIEFLAFGGDQGNRCELFDESNLDAALALFDERNSRPAPELASTASRVIERFWECFAARDWASLANMLTEDSSSEDRRHVVGSGVLRGREAGIADLRAIAGVGAQNFTPTFIATRGERLVLGRFRVTGPDQRPDEFYVEMLGVVEINTDEKIVARIAFDSNDIDAAFAELDARYVAGEAAAHAHTWSVVSAAYAALNRHEIPATTPDWVTIDHRRLGTADAADLTTFLRATWELMPHASGHIVAVHRLSSQGAVVTQVSRGESPQGFAAEWREISISMVDGDLLSRCEIFDETDLADALARFDELHTGPAPRLDNAASQAVERFFASFGDHNWAAIPDILTEESFIDDRRSVVNGGIWHGREVVIANLRALAETEAKPTSTVIATRGERLALSHIYAPNRYPHREYHGELLGIAEIDTDGRITAQILLDHNNFDAAFAELDRRYLTGEAGTNARTWSLVTQTFAGFNRRDLAATTPDWVNVDHRRGIPFAPGDMINYIRTAWDVAPDVKYYVRSTHRLNNRGAVVTAAGHGTSPQGFTAEWAEIYLFTFADESINRCEVFEEEHLDTALAKFDELTSQATQLDNSMTRAWERLVAAFARRDVDAFVNLTSPNGHFEDRRRGLRDSQSGSMRRRVVKTLFEFPENWRLEVEHIAIRGSRLCLSRQTYRDIDEPGRPVTVDALSVSEGSDDDLVKSIVLFDVDEIDAAFEELEALYLAGEAAAHARTWSVIAGAYAAVNRRELPPTTQDWVNIDHRRAIAFAPGDLGAYLRATWDVLAPGANAHIEIVHRLSDLGAVVTRKITGTTQAGFDAEWREIGLSIVDGDQIKRSEIFDESDLNAALARFDELSAVSPRLANAATRVRARTADAYNRRDVEAFLALANGCYEDRRRGLRDEGAGDHNYAHAVLSETPTSWRLEMEPIAIRGDRLALTRETFRDHREEDRPITVDLIVLTELSDDESLAYTVFFDAGDISAAMTELSSRWIARGEVAHPEVIWAVRRLEEVTNRHDWAALGTLEAGATFVNHRQLSPGPGVETIADHLRSIEATALLVPDYWIEYAEILTHSATGVVASLVLKGTSTENFAIELPVISLILFDGERVTRLENFDPAQRDLALARFDELNQPATHLENAATQAWARAVGAFNRSDPDGFRALAAADCWFEDRRKGLRDEGHVRPEHVLEMFEQLGAFRHEAETIAVRGSHLALCRNRFRDQYDQENPVAIENFVLTEVDEANLVRALIVFDPEDLDGAMGELTSRWIASGEVAHPEVIQTVTRIAEIFNRHDWSEIDARCAGATYVSHRQLGTPGTTAEEFLESTRTFEPLAPDVHVVIAEVLAHLAGAVAVRFVVRGTTDAGLDIEIPFLMLLQVSGDHITHIETYELDQRAAALSRFEELTAS